jgi:hypothetical protein
MSKVDELINDIWDEKCNPNKHRFKSDFDKWIRGKLKQSLTAQREELKKKVVEVLAKHEVDSIFLVNEITTIFSEVEE